MNVNSLSFRVCIYFASNPGEWLSTHDIKEKFDVCNVDQVRHALKVVKRHGMVATDLRNGTKNGPGCGFLWSAGPALLKMLGQ
jgi:pantoate kinase